MMLMSIALSSLVPGLYAQPLEIEWQSCTLVPDEDDGLAQCAEVPLPLFHDAPEGPTIAIAVKRLQLSQTARAQFWFINGGPGDPGTTSFLLPASFVNVLSDLDIYTVDHRGTGGSQRLSCPVQEAPESDGGREITDSEKADCAAYLLNEYGDRLAAYSTTESARDLAALIEATRRPGQEVYIWGVSYGTYLVNRYLQLFPEQPSAVILDGLVPATWGFESFDASMDLVGRRLLARCADDADCRAHLGPDPAARTGNLIDMLAAGHCSELAIGPDEFREILGALLLVGSPLRSYIPAIIHRLQRCSETDQAALNHLAEVLGEELGEPPSHAQALQLHVALSDMWNDDAPGADLLEANLENYLMATGVSASFARAREFWPVYNQQPADAFADYDGPLLMLHGGLDPTMTGEALEEMILHFNGPYQTFAFFPDGQHGILSDNDCAAALYIAFLTDPTAPLDLTCIADSPALAFDGDPALTELLFGTPDLWGDPVSVVEEQSGPAGPALLGDCFPNPLPASSGGKRGQFSFEIHSRVPVRVELGIYDVHGRCLRSLLQGSRASGRYTIDWNGLDDHGRYLPAGLYFYQLSSAVGRQTKTLLLR